MHDVLSSICHQFSYHVTLQAQYLIPHPLHTMRWIPVDFISHLYILSTHLYLYSSIYISIHPSINILYLYIHRFIHSSSPSCLCAHFIYQSRLFCLFCLIYPLNLFLASIASIQLLIRYVPSCLIIHLFITFHLLNLSIPTTSIPSVHPFYLPRLSRPPYASVPSTLSSAIHPYFYVSYSHRPFNHPTYLIIPFI